MADNKVYEMVTEEIVKALEAGTAPWHKPWNDTGLPMSLSTRKPYRGVNVFLLGVVGMAHGYTSPWWGTYDRIAELCGMVKNAKGRWESKDGAPLGVRKGEKGALVTFWKRYEKEVVNVDTGKLEKKKVFILRYYKVFNACQADGLPAQFYQGAERPLDFSPIAACEAIVDSYRNGPTIGHGPGGAYYRPSMDIVNMPDKDTFTGCEEYYSTLFHELTHSTGHGSRLNREAIADIENHTFGDALYSKEELVAEMGAAMLSAVAGIHQTTLPNSAAYLASWIRVLKGSPKLLVQAGAAAQRAADLIQGVSYANDEPVLVAQAA